MGRKPESKIVEKILIALREAEPTSYFRKIHGNEFQHAGIPDIIGCAYGIFIGMEVKTPDGEVSRIQVHEMVQIRNAGGITGVVYGPEGALAVLKSAKRLSES